MGPGGLTVRRDEPAWASLGLPSRRNGSGTSSVVRDTLPTRPSGGKEGVLVAWGYDETGQRRRLRSTNLLERSLEEVTRRTKVIGRFPGETSCLSLCRAVLDLFIASARGLALTALEHRQLAQMHAAQTARTPDSL